MIVSMYLKRNRRLKDGKEHVYWNTVWALESG